MRRLALVTSFLVTAAAGCEMSATTATGYPRAPAAYSRSFDSRWVPLAEGYSAQASRQFIEVGGDRLHKLRIEPEQGAPVIRKIAVDYMDGTQQAFRVDRQLPRGTAQVIDLNRTPVARIIVYSDPGIAGSYSVYGT